MKFFKSISTHITHQEYTESVLKLFSALCNVFLNYETYNLLHAVMSQIYLQQRMLSFDAKDLCISWITQKDSVKRTIK